MNEAQEPELPLPEGLDQDTPPSPKKKAAKKAVKKVAKKAVKKTAKKTTKKAVKKAAKKAAKRMPAESSEEVVAPDLAPLGLFVEMEEEVVPLEKSSRKEPCEEKGESRGAPKAEVEEERRKQKHSPKSFPPEERRPLRHLLPRFLKRSPFQSFAKNLWLNFMRKSSVCRFAFLPNRPKRSSFTPFYLVTLFMALTSWVRGC